MKTFIGRKKEMFYALNQVSAKERSFTVLLGARGVGKTTFLEVLGSRVKGLFQEVIVLSFKGDFNQSDKNQREIFLYSFCSQMNINIDKISVKKEWFFIFDFIKKELIKREKKVVFLIDEFSWFQNQRSSFFLSFTQFFEALNRQDVHFFVTGSVITWLAKNLLTSKGNFFQRTQKITLSPFNLFEVAEYLKDKNETMPVRDIVRYAMFTGGMPRLLSKIEQFSTVAKNLEKIFPRDNQIVGGELKSVFDYTFHSKSGINLHYNIVSLFKDKMLVEAKQVAESLKVSLATATKTLEELTFSGILAKQKTNGKKSDSYRLVDLYCYFAFKILEDKTFDLSKLNAIIEGMAFEILCFNNIELIKEKIGKNLQSHQYRWQSEKAQIDIVVEYPQLNKFLLVECKHYSDIFVIDESYRRTLDVKRLAFEESLLNKTRAKTSISHLFVSVFGAREVNRPMNYEQIILADEIEKHLAIKKLNLTEIY